MGPREEHRLGARRVVGGLYRIDNDRVVGREMADRVGAGRVPGQVERLATAPAEVDFAALAAAARVCHPAGAAEALESG
jgi:hypothetical protein